MLLLAVAELLVRWTGASERCPGYENNLLLACDPVFFFRANPSQVIHGKPLNRHGFRTHEFTPKKPGTLRVLALGDSSTFGVISPGPARSLVWLREPYPEKLERLAAERNASPEVEVLNAGVPGYNSFQGLLLLRTRLRGLAPDLVTVRFGWNDHLMSPAGRLPGAFREPEATWRRTLQDLLYRTALYGFALRLGMEVRYLFAELPAPSLPARWEPDVPLPLFRRNLRRIVEVGRKEGAQVWLLTSPHAFLTSEHRDRPEHFPPSSAAGFLLEANALSSYEELVRIHERYNEAIRKVALETASRLVDLEEVYRRHAEEHLFEEGDCVHPNDAGHELEARVLYEELLRTGLLRESPTRVGADSARRDAKPHRPPGRRDAEAAKLAESHGAPYARAPNGSQEEEKGW